MSPNHFTLYSPLAPAECVIRLKAVTGHFPINLQPVYGSITDHSMIISETRICRFPGEISLTATFTAKDSGTLLTGELSSPKAEVGKVMAIAALVIAAITIGLFNLISGNPGAALLALPPLGVAFLIGWIGKSAKENAKDPFLLHFLMRTIQATPVKSD